MSKGNLKAAERRRAERSETARGEAEGKPKDHRSKGPRDEKTKRPQPRKRGSAAHDLASWDAGDLFPSGRTSPFRAGSHRTNRLQQNLNCSGSGKKSDTRTFGKKSLCHVWGPLNRIYAAPVAEALHEDGGERRTDGEDADQVRRDEELRPVGSREQPRQDSGCGNGRSDYP